MMCSFCGKNIMEGMGKLLVKSDGNLLYFCGSKCEKNAGMRDNKKVKWTARYSKEKERVKKTKNKEA